MSTTNTLKLFNGRGVKAPYKIRELLGLNGKSSALARKKQPTYIKGVRNGNYFRIKIPPKRKVFPDVPKLPNAIPMPKPFKATPQEAVVKAAESATKVEGITVRLMGWLKRNAPIIMLNVGSVCTLVGFTRSDVLELRSLATTGNIMFIFYALGQRPVLWPSIAWSALFASVNGVKIFQIMHERTATVHMTKDQEQTFVEHFMPHGLTPKQFERVEQKAKKIRLKKGEFLIRKGEKMDHLYLVAKGSTQALLLGRQVTAASTNARTKGDQKEGGDSGAWIGEIAFLDWFWEREQGKTKVNSDESSALDEKSLSAGVAPKRGLGLSFYSILTKEDCIVLAWSHDDMQELMHGSTELRAALTRAMTSALVGKVVNLTVSRTQGTRPWTSWLSDWKSKDGAEVQIQRTDSLKKEKEQEQEPAKPMPAGLDDPILVLP
jgi:CRP-like cAMP-binding protein